MADERKHIDDVFTEGLRGYSEMPPPQAWGALEAKLDQRGGRRRLAWWWYVVAGITLVSTGFLFFANRDEHKVITKASKNGSGKNISTQAPVHEPATVKAPGTALADASAQPVITTNEEPVIIPQQLTKPEVVSTPGKPVTPNKVTSKDKATVPGHITKANKPDNKQQSLARVKGDLAEDKEQASIADAKPAAGSREIVTVESIAVIQTHQTLEDNIRLRTGVVMNIKKLPPIPSVSDDTDIPLAKVEPIDTVTAPQSENHGPVQKASLIVSADNDDMPLATGRALGATVADSIVNSVVQDVAAETEKLLASIQDAVAPTGPSAIVVSDTFEPVLPGSDSFIGPMPDASVFAAIAAVADAAPEDDKPAYKMNFESFIKAGYEKGFGDYTMNKFVFAPMLQLNLSPKFSLVLQPTIKAGTLNRSDIAVGPRDSLGNLVSAYHNIKSSVVDSYKLYSTWSNAQGIIYDSVKAQYYYRQTYDSVTVNSKLQAKTLYEIELPLLLNYQFSKRVSLYAGPTVNYSKIAWVDVNTQVYEGLVRQDTLTYYTSRAAAQQISGPKISEVIQYNTADFNKLEHPYVINPTENKLRMGIMLGSTININNKLTFDILMQQNLSRMNYIPNSQVKSIYLQPYFRFMLGYKVFGSNKK